MILIIDLKSLNIICLLAWDFLFLIGKQDFLWRFSAIQHILPLLFTLRAREEYRVLKTEWASIRKETFV